MGNEIRVLISLQLFFEHISDYKYNSPSNYHEMYVGFHVKCPLLISGFNKTWSGPVAQSV